MVFDDGKDGRGRHVEADAIELTALSSREKDLTVNGGTVEKNMLGNKYDQHDMRRMGKRQELQRHFQFFSIWGYAIILGCTWEWGLASGVFSLTNGGTAGAIWMFLITCFCMFFVMLSMAEMASIAPTSGGQYHWVSEFSPKRYQRPISYTTGWFALLGWQTSLVGTAYAAAQQFEAMVALSDPTYTPQGWHGCLFTIGLTVAAIFFNTTVFRHLPLMEGIVVIFLIFGFLAIVVVLWVMGPRGGKETVTTFSGNGWSDAGLSCLVGILSPIITLIGADSQCHLSEELKDAAFVLARAMVATATANYVMGFLMVLTIMFTIGPDVDGVLQTPLGVPWVQILYNATNSYAAAMTFAGSVGILFTCCLINNVTAASRQLWSFARGGGIPFASFFAKVHAGWDVPVNAMIFTLGITVVLSLFIIGTPKSPAFAILTSLSLTGLISSYLLAVICVFWKRLRGEHFPPGRFNLGRFGLFCNTVAMAFLAIASTFMFFPTAPDPGAKGMNWSIVIYAAVVVIFTAYYFVRGKHQYDGPVEYVSKDI